MTSDNRATLRLVPPLPAAPGPPAPDVPAPRRPSGGPARTSEGLGGGPPVIEPLGDGTAPGEAECLPCYVDRMATREGCDGSLRWTRRWRDARAPRAAKLEARLATRGGYCDCEVVVNVYPGHFPVPTDDADAPVGSAEVERPPCGGRTGGSATDPCRPQARPWWA